MGVWDRGHGRRKIWQDLGFRGSGFRVGLKRLWQRSSGFCFSF